MAADAKPAGTTTPAEREPADGYRRKPVEPAKPSPGTGVDRALEPRRPAGGYKTKG